MKRIARRILVSIGVIFLMMQFYQPARNRDNGEIALTHIYKTFNLPDSVTDIIKTSCNDCHSNNTHYPWYSYIQPARFIMERHIRNGKKDLNFSEFGSYTKRRQESKLKSISKQVGSGKMPLPAYVLLHKNAKLNDMQRQTIINWVDTVLKRFE